MQTPDSSPHQQRTKTSTISTLSPKSWFNLRSKTGSKSPSSLKSEFHFHSANISPTKPNSSKLDLSDLPQMEARIQSEASPTECKHEKQTQFESSLNLDELFDNGLGLNTIEGDLSDAKSQFSVGKSSSFRYYKYSDTLGNSFLNFNRKRSDSCGHHSFRSVSDTTSSDVGSMDEDFDLYNQLYDHLDDVEDTEDSDVFADMIAEVNMVADDEDLVNALSRQRSSSSSTHRQLSQVTRDDHFMRAFEQSGPKRTRSMISNASTVLPIKE